MKRTMMSSLPKGIKKRIYLNSFFSSLLLQTLCQFDYIWVYTSAQTSIGANDQHQVSFGIWRNFRWIDSTIFCKHSLVSIISSRFDLSKEVQIDPKNYCFFFYNVPPSTLISVTLSDAVKNCRVGKSLDWASRSFAFAISLRVLVIFAALPILFNLFLTVCC